MSMEVELIRLRYIIFEEPKLSVINFLHFLNFVMVFGIPLYPADNTENVADNNNVFRFSAFLHKDVISSFTAE